MVASVNDLTTPTPVVRSPSSSQPYFHGYASVHVWLYLVSKSLMGVTANLVFKRGGAVVKSMAPPLVGAVLVAASAALYGREVKAEEAKGSLTVLAAAFLYLRQQPPTVS